MDQPGVFERPLLPGYGIGGLLITSLLRPFTGFPFYIEIPLVFVAGTLLTTILEYFTGWLLETCSTPPGGITPKTDLTIKAVFAY